MEEAASQATRRTGDEPYAFEDGRTMEDLMTNPILPGRRVDLARFAGARAAPVVRLARQLSGAISRYLRNRRVERQLWDMSEYQLRDLGITRGEIREVAWRRDT